LPRNVLAFRHARALIRTEAMTVNGHAQAVVRDETEADMAAVRDLVTAAFGQPDEARLVDQLRGQPGVLSFVAGADGAVIGHVMFSPIDGQTRRSGLRGVGLAPLAVRPDWQGRGVGAALVRHGLAACRARSLGLVVVLGDPAFYSRFGFVPARPMGLVCKWSADTDHFMCLELEPGHAARAGGVVRYSPEFDAF
jgi:putative acetyltransferase